MKRYRVRVVFASGAIVRFRCRDITVSRAAGHVTAISWVGARPRPLFLALDGIESVWCRRAWWPL